jgi:hypothetical protein
MYAINAKNCGAKGILVGGVESIDLNESSYRAVVQRKTVCFKFSISNFIKGEKRHRYARFNPPT